MPLNYQDINRSNYIYYTNIAGNPGGRDDKFRLIKRKTPEVSDKPPTVVSPMKVDKLGWEKLGGCRKKKTRKKRGGAPKFLCGKDEVFWPGVPSRPGGTLGVPRAPRKPQ